jgi:hypothetical protein
LPKIENNTQRYITMDTKHIYDNIPVIDTTNYAKNIEEKLSSIVVTLTEFKKLFDLQEKNIEMQAKTNKELLEELKILRKPVNN